MSGECANERGSNAQNRIRTVRELGERPSNLDNAEGADQIDAPGPLPVLARHPDTGEFPVNLAITDWESRLKHDYVPSRKRYKPSIADACAALAQRTGDSLPCLIPEHRSQEVALRMALELNPFERVLANALSPAEQEGVKFNCTNPTRVKRMRHKATKRLESLRGELHLGKVRFSNGLPVLAPARKLRIPLIQKLIGGLNYTDKTLAKDLVAGMPIAGAIPRTTALPMKETTETLNLQDVRTAVRDTNTTILKSITKSNDSQLKQK